MAGASSLPSIRLGLSATESAAGMPEVSLPRNDDREPDGSGGGAACVPSTISSASGASPEVTWKDRGCMTACRARRPRMLRALRNLWRFEL